MVKINRIVKKELHATIRANIKRYISLVLMILLGVGFYVGMKSSAPSLEKTMADYFEKAKYMDIEILSETGLTDEEISKIKDKVPEIENIEGGYHTDLKINLYDEDTEDYSDYIVAVHSYNKDKVINHIEVDEGKYPEKDNEILVDSSLGHLGYELGDKITVDSQYLKEKELTITGFGKSVLYISDEMGASKFLSGKIEFFMFINESNFETDENNPYYTSAYIKLKKKYESFTDEYDQYVKKSIDKIEKISSEISEERRKKLINSKTNEIEEAEKKYNIEKIKADKELKSAKDKIDKAEKEIAKAETKVLSDNEVELYLTSSQLKLEAAKNQLDLSKSLLDVAKNAMNDVSKSLSVKTSSNKVNKNLNQLNNPNNKYNVKKIKNSIYDDFVDVLNIILYANELTDEISDLNDQLKTLNEQYKNKELECSNIAGADASKICESALEKIEDNMDIITEKKEMLEDELDELNVLIDRINELSASIKKLKNEISELESNVNDLTTQITTKGNQCKALQDKSLQEKCQSELDELKQDKKDIEDKLNEKIQMLDDYESIVKAIEDLSKIEDKTNSTKSDYQKYIDNLQKKYNAGLREYKKGLKEYNYAKKNLKKEMASARKKLNSKKAELEKAKQIYNDNYKEVTIKLEQAYNQIIEGKKLLKTLETKKWNIFSRNDAYGYNNYSADIDRIKGISKLFPITFFLVAALVASSTVNRLIQEERTKIGVFKSLGYGNKHIIYKYVYYAASASLIGIIIGTIVGIEVFPKVFQEIYTLLYWIPKMEIKISITNIILAAVFAMLSTVTVILLTIKETLKEQPYMLMTPKSEEVKKRTFLERQKKLWNNLPFANKVSYRNIFRKIKRSLMTILGIAGCTALIITGFGTRDSIADVIFIQYEKIIDASAEFFYKDNLTDYEMKEEQTRIENMKYVEKTVIGRQEMIEVTYENIIHTVYNIIPDDASSANKIVTFNNVENSEELKLTNKGVIITEKLAKILGISSGDYITYTDIYDAEHKVLVTGVTENYVYEYMYMTKDLYKEVNDIDSINNALYVKFNDNVDSKKMIDTINKNEKFSSYISLDDARDAYDSIMQKFNSIIVVITISAGLLAFVVLNNLAKMNISERLSEIATLKVLGYRPKEVNKYINNEMKILTAIGIVFGMIMGFFLTDVVVTTCEMGEMMFYHGISYVSYIYGVIITIIFSKIINLFVRRDLNRIKMVESLKTKE